MIGHLGHIPVSINQYVYQHNLETYYRTFLALKYRFALSGNFKRDDVNVLHVIEELGISRRTFSNHIKKLIHIGFLDVDGYDLHYIRGYNYIRKSKKLKKGRKVEFTYSDLTPMKFASYIFGSVVGYLVLKRRFDKRRAELDKDGLKQPRRKSKISRKDDTFPLSARYLSKLIGGSKSKINDRLKEAVNNKYLYLYKDFERLEVPVVYLQELIKQHQEGESFPIVRNGQIYLQHPFRYSNMLHYKRITK